MTENFSEKAIKEYCKQCVERSNLNDIQKELLKSAVDAAKNMKELIETGIIGLMGSHG